MAAGVVGLIILFSVLDLPNIYTVSLRHLHHLNVQNMLSNCFMMLGWYLYNIIRKLYFFSHWKQRIVVLTALSAPMAPWVVSTTNYGATGDGEIYRLDYLCFQCSLNMTFTLDFTVICASQKCLWFIHFVHLIYFAWISYHKENGCRQYHMSLKVWHCIATEYYLEP